MFDLLSNIAMMFGGAGDVGTTPIEQGVGYSPEIPMSTGVDTGMNVPAQPTDASAGVSPSLWQQILNFAGMNRGGTQDTSGNEIDPKTGKSTGKKDDLAAFGKFLTAAQGAQSSLQDSKMAQQMMQQHVNQPQQQGSYRPPQDMATVILRNAGLL